MSTRRFGWALSIGLLAGCGGSESGGAAVSGNETLMRTLIQSVIDGDKDAYLRCHVQKDEMTKDGSGYLAVEPGGGSPDDSWFALVQAAFVKDRAAFEKLGREHGTVTFGGVLKATEEEQTPARRIWSTQVLLKCGDARYVAEIGRSGETSRGRVLQGPPGLTLRKQ